MPAKPNLVFFLGAGFSVPIGIPTMNAFPDRIRSSAMLDPSEQREFDLIQVACGSLASTIGASARNLEQLASFLSVLGMARPDFVFPGCDQYKRPSDALGLIKRCLRKLTLPELKSQQAQGVQRIVGQTESFNISIITTNYDLHVELGAVASGTRVCPTASVLRACQPGTVSSGGPLLSLYRPDSSNECIRLFKLHGSVNWFQTAAGFEVEDRLRPTPEFNEERERRWYWIGDAEGHYLTRSDAVIVPPTVVKPELIGALGEQWAGACKAMSEADALWFVGYSFPESDSFMRYFIGSALVENPRLRQIVVVDPDPNVLEARARPLFDAPHLQEVFQAYPMKWAECPMEVILSGQTQGVLNEQQIKAMELRIRERNVLQGSMAGVVEEEPRHAGLRSRSRLRRGR